jgi:hypothetical protein
MTRGIEIAPITFQVGTGDDLKNLSFRDTCAKTADAAGVRRFKRYGRGRRLLFDLMDRHYVIFSILPFGALIFGGAGCLIMFLTENELITLWLLLLAYGIMPMAIHTLLFRNADATDPPEWLRDYLARRASVFQRLLEDERALAAWARHVEYDEDRTEALRAQTQARRSAIEQGMTAYLDALRRAIVHPERVQRLWSAKALADAAFPPSADGSDSATAAHADILAVAEAVRAEAVELGFPTDEIDAFLRTGGKEDFDPSAVRC